jgi:ABC-type polar amino acid transport system ATPase subunit
VLACRSISQVYGSTPVLAEVSLDVRAGELHQVSGPSGGGKTTLLRILCLLESPTLGTVSLDGAEFRHHDIFSRSAWILNQPFRNAVTLVSQQIFLWPHLTCRQNIEMAGGDESTYEEFAAELDVAKCLERYPNQVSVGQRQRIALIRAIATKPHFLLLDEVTSALDNRMCGIATAVLEDLVGKGIGILFVTHREHEWQRTVPKRWWIEHGRMSCRR